MMLEALAEWPLAVALRSSAIVYPLVSAAHIASIDPRRHSHIGSTASRGFPVAFHRSPCAATDRCRHCRPRRRHRDGVPAVQHPPRRLCPESGVPCQDRLARLRRIECPGAPVSSLVARWRTSRRGPDSCSGRGVVLAPVLAVRYRRGPMDWIPPVVGQERSDTFPPCIGLSRFVKVMHSIRRQSWLVACHLPVRSLAPRGRSEGMTGAGT